MEMLTRTAVTVEEVNLDDPIRELALQAESLLGYSVLRDEAHLATPLRRTLAKLEIEILDQESVDRYKTQMVEHLDTSHKMAMPTWRLAPLERYGEPVPEFVLMKAIAIKKELPEARFYIDHLAVDPFLIVSTKPLPDSAVNQRSRYLDPDWAAYIEVWKEPKFESQL